MSCPARLKMMRNKHRIRIYGKQHHLSQDGAIKLLPPFAYLTAGNFLSGIAGGLRVEVIGITVDHHSPSNNFIHEKPICFHGQICMSLACQ